MTHDKSRDPDRFDYMSVSKYRWESGTIGSRTGTVGLSGEVAPSVPVLGIFIIIALLNDRYFMNNLPIVGKRGS